jgi:hypothetical protein
MAGQFPLALHVALDVAVRTLLPIAVAAEATLAGSCSPRVREHAMAVLQHNGALRARRRAASGAAGFPFDALAVDGCTWDAPDVDGVVQ